MLYLKCSVTPVLRTSETRAYARNPVREKLIVGGQNSIKKRHEKSQRTYRVGTPTQLWMCEMPMFPNSAVVSL